MMETRLHPYVIYATLYVFLAIFLGFILTDGLIFFLGWNMILATISLGLSLLYHHQRQKRPQAASNHVVMGLYILFFPNALYILSDFIHFENANFFLNYPNIYRYDLAEWLLFFHIVIGAMIAVRIGLESLEYMKRAIPEPMRKKWPLTLSALFLLSSAGIYIGRFLRFNSWEFYRIIEITRGLFSHLGFMIGFVLIFFVLHWVIYLLFSTETKNRYNKDNET